jgi:uncharacterized protein
MRRLKNPLLVAVILLCAAGMVEVRGSIEAKFIFPGAATQGRAEAIVPPSADYEIVPLQTKDGTKIVALFGGALDPRGGHTLVAGSRPTVIFFYGNGACLASMGDVFDGFRRLGVNVLMPEYPGYGMSGGKPSEKAFYAAADAAYDYVMQRPGIDRQRIVAAGWSMGSAVAIDLAARRRVSSLVLVSAFTSMPAVAHALVKWFPTSLIVRSRFDSLAKMPLVGCPVFIAHGTRDELVPPSMSGKLAEAVKTEVTSYKVAGGGHNDVFAVGGRPLWEAIEVFIFGVKSPIS